MKNVLLFLLLSLLICLPQAWAQQIITFGPRETRITGSIPYTVIGHYRAQFGLFKGRITLDENAQPRLVYLEIEAGTIKSSWPWCDKLARSRRLLNTARYPKIIFKSDAIVRDEGGYQVKGVLQMHGVRKKMIFPFHATTGNHRIDIRGTWIINRKDFNIIWSRRLDHGGLVVGDDFTVDWGIKERF